MLRRVSLLVCILGLVATVVACSGPDKTLETTVKDLQSKVDTLQTKLDTATQADSTLKTDLATQTNNLKTLTSKVTTLETSLQNHMNPPLALEIKSLTTPVLQGGKTTLVVKTEPGTRVSVNMKLPAGKTQPSALKDKTAGKDGLVEWTWTVAKDLPAGTYVVSVSARSQNRTASGTTNLVVNAPAPKPAKTTTK